MNRKPITEHLADLPEEYREEALRLHKEIGWPDFEEKNGFTYELQSTALVNAFPFIHKKWADLYNDIKSKGL